MLCTVCRLCVSQCSMVMFVKQCNCISVELMYVFRFSRYHELYISFTFYCHLNVLDSHFYHHFGHCCYLFIVLLSVFIFVGF